MPIRREIQTIEMLKEGEYKLAGNKNHGLGRVDASTVEGVVQLEVKWGGGSNRKEEGRSLRKRPQLK